MADLLPNKLLHSLSFNSRFSLPLNLSPQLNFSIIRFTPLRRRRRLSHSSSSVLANLSPDSTRLGIVSISEQSDGSVVFKFGDASENSQSFENVDASDTKLEVLGALDDEENGNHTNSELVGASDGQDEAKVERESVSIGEIPEVDVMESNEVENESVEVEDFTESKAEDNEGTKARDLANSESEPEETVLGSFTQSNVDCVEDEQNYGLISTVEIENSSDSEMVKHDVETNSLTISDSNVDLVMENSDDSEMVNNDRIDTVVTNVDCNGDLIMEKFNETRNGEVEVVAAVSTSQLQLDSNDLQEISEQSSSVKGSEPVVSLDDSELESNRKHVGNEGDDDNDNDSLEITETNSVIEASDMGVSSEDDELDSNLKQVANDENVDDRSQEIVDMNSLIEASDSNVKHVVNDEHDDNDELEIVDANSAIEASDMFVSLENDDFDNNVEQVENQKDNDHDALKIAETNSPIEASEMAVSLDDDIYESSVKQVVANDEVDDNKLKENAGLNLLVEVLNMAVSLENSELDRNVKHVANEENVSNDMLEISETNSPIEASEVAVSLEDYKPESSVKQVVANEEVDDNKLKDNAALNLVVEASNMAVSLKNSELDSNVDYVTNEEDVGNDMLEISETNSPIEASEMAVSLEDHKLQSFVKQVVGNEEVDDKKSKENAGLNLLDEASNMAVSLENSELDSNMKHVDNEEDVGNDMLELSEINSPIEASEMAASLEDDQIDSNVKQVLANKEEDDNKLQETADRNLQVETSDMAVSLEGSELDSNETRMENENDDSVDLVEKPAQLGAEPILDGVSCDSGEDVGNDMLELSERNSPIEVSEIAASLEDEQIDSNVKQVLANKEEDDIKFQESADRNSQVDTLDMAVSLEGSELDSNETSMVNKNDDWVELSEKPAQLEAEPILDEEVSCDSGADVVALESTSAPNMVEDAAPSVIPLSDDAPVGDDLSKAACHDASDIAVAEANVDSVSSVEIATPTLNLSSAAASLPHSSEVLSGGEDAFFVCQNWFGVADGVGQWSFGGIDRGRYTHELMQNCEKVALNSQSAGLTDIKDALQQIAAMTESTGAARVLIAHFANQSLHVANIGDTGFVTVRNGKIFKKSSPMVHEFNFPYAIGSGVDPLEAVEEYHIELEDGDVIVGATDGLFDNLYEQEIASIVSKSLGAGMEPKELAELLVTKAQEMGSSPHGRSPFADAAQAAGHTGVVGGKLDHVTVIVSLVQTSK